MKKDWLGLYKYKGFTLGYSEMYQEWTLEPNFLIKEFGDSSEVLDFATNNSICIDLKTLKEAKAWITENEKEIKEELRNQFKEEYKELVK